MTGRILPDLSAVLPSSAEIVRLPRRRGRAPVSASRIVELAKTHTDQEIAGMLGCSVHTVALRRREAGIRRRGGRKESSQGPRSRFAPAVHAEKHATLPPVTHPALSDARTIYPTTVVNALGLNSLLVSGANAWKIGDRVAKGKWKGFPIFTLTLEERATCPTSCRHWRSCFGNHMNWAKRVANDDAFEDRLGHELAILQYRFPEGFAVRVHVLGDFYSEHYVGLWRSFLDRFPALHVFGFSARVDAGDPIARALIDLVAEQWDRFAIRFSNAPVDECSTISIEHPVQKPADAVICPQQLGKTANCGSCGFCWHSRRRVAFLQH